MSGKCATCCEFDHLKNHKTGYCVQSRIHENNGVVSEDYSCRYYIEGNFADRIRLRAERRANEQK